MKNQIDVLDENRILPQLSYDGLRKVENLPKDIRKSAGDDLFLPPLYMEKPLASNPRILSGRLTDNENSHNSKQIVSGKTLSLPKYTQRNLEPLESIYQSRKNSLSKFSQYQDVRTKYYKQYLTPTPIIQKKQVYTPVEQRYSVDSRKPAVRYPLPNTGYSPARYNPTQRYGVGGLPRARSNIGLNYYNKPSVYNQKYDSESRQNLAQEPAPAQPIFTPLTQEDYTMEALQQKRSLLEQLNDRMRNMA